MGLAGMQSWDDLRTVTLYRCMIAATLAYYGAVLMEGCARSAHACRYM